MIQGSWNSPGYLNLILWGYISHFSSVFLGRVGDPLMKSPQSSSLSSGVLPITLQDHGNLTACIASSRVCLGPNNFENYWSCTLQSQISHLYTFFSFYCAFFSPARRITFGYPWNFSSSPVNHSIIIEVRT